METPCSRPVQIITENEFLGNSLRKLNDNFQVLQLNICHLEHLISALSKQLTEIGIPEEPRCGKKEELDLCPEIEKTVLIPDPETCVQETRLPLVNSFINLKELACNLYTTIQSLSSTVNKNPAAADTTQAAPFNPIGCTYTDGISPDEYLGDSYDKIRNNLKNLRDKYCTISKLVNNLEKRITCPKPPPKRQKLIDRFTMQGEGGYAWNTYNFVNKDKVYAPQSYANSIRDIMTQAEYDKYKYSITFEGTQFYGLSGALRVSQAAYNNTVILRNGVFYFSGGSPNGPYRSNWIAQNAKNMYDMFMPSTHNADPSPTQVVLLTTGDLHFLDLREVKTNSSHIPPIILPNIERFAAINQSHNSDLIVISKDKKVYHVGVNSTTGSPATYAYQEITNMGNTDDIAFMQIGDAADSCYVCYKSDLTKVYPINCSVSNRTGHNQWGWFTSSSNTPKSITLDIDEYFVDGCSNEFDNVFLTNKRVLCYHNIDTCCGGTCSVTYTEHTLPFGSKAVRMATSCSYSMAVELSDGYYLLSRRPISEYATGASIAACNGYPTYQYFAKFDYWNTLIRNLSATRPDIFGFGGDAAKCSCDPAPPPEPPPGCEPKRQDLLDRFAMQGEGGYHAFTFNFVDKDKIYGNAVYSKTYKSVLDSYETLYNYTTSIGGRDWYALRNAIRICAGNNNVSGIFRDGMGYVNGVQYYHQWIKNTHINWKDLFMPSSYADPAKGEISQGVLLKTGELYALLLNAKDIVGKTTWPTSGPPVLQGVTVTGSTVDLNNIDRFLTINQAHNGDIIVGGKDDRVWHVGFARGALTDRGGSARQIKNLEASKIQCIAAGDNSYSGICVLKADRTKIFEITSEYRDLFKFGWWLERNLTPICAGVNKPLVISGYTVNNFLSSEEFVIDACANEFHLTILTNKNVHTFHGNYNYTARVNGRVVTGHKTYTLSPGVSAIRLCTATSYNMAVELSDGYYLLSHTNEAGYESSVNDGGIDGHDMIYPYFSKINSWTTLALNLTSGRPDIVPFGSSCDQPANWNCIKTFVEEAEVLAFPETTDVTLQTNLFYPVSAYQEGGAWLDGGGAGFTGTTTVTFRHPNYPTEPDKIFTYNSDPNSSTGDAIIWWSSAVNQVNTYFNYPTGMIKSEALPWSERTDILVAYNFTGGINGSVVAKQYKEPDTSICFFL
jgi:hypothetical protein